MINPASFKDPSGFVFENNGRLYRQVNQSYAPHYTHLMQSGLYASLVQKGFLIPHTELEKNILPDPACWRTLEPERVSFISYPYEWCFDQLKDAALLTLSIVRDSVEKGMILKDATPYNIQFHKGRPVFIDSLSFEIYNPSQPWVAYRQFCELFLFPLYLEHYLSVNSIQWLSHYIHGIPASVTARLLPWKSRWNLGVRLHVLLQSNMSSDGKAGKPSGKVSFSKQKLLNLISHLESIIRSLQPGYPRVSTWSNYYEETILGKDYLNEKEKLVKEFTSAITFTTVTDLGANDGHFSRLLAGKDIEMIAADSDPNCINRLYQEIKQKGTGNILPLIEDLTNPAPAIGFNNQERKSFQQRLQPGLVLALALIHHLCIARNIPLSLLVDYFASFSPWLLIEFVPREDEKVKQLLSSREDIFEDYTAASFEKYFSKSFSIEKKSVIPGTSRIMYLLKRK